MQIRQAREADRDAIAAVHLASVRGVAPGAYDEAALAAWEASLASVEYAIDEPGATVLVADRDGDVAGFAEGSMGDPELDKLYVAPAHQGRGVATELAETVEAELRSRGAESVYVEASLNAVPFYESAGYVRVGSHRKAFPADSTTAEMGVVDMEKVLR